MEIFDWDNAAGGNGFTVPDGFPEGMNYSDVNNAARELMAVLARWYTDTSGELVTAGTGTAYTLAAARTLVGYADGQMFRFRAHTGNSGSATINISAQGAATLYRPDGTTLDGNEIKANGIYEIVYSSGLSGFVLSATGVAASVSNRGEVELATDAEAIAKTAADRAITPENLAALDLWQDSRYFESAEQSIVDGTTLTLPHSLGAKPKLLECVVICKTAEFGYAVGDEAVVDGVFIQGLNDRGVQVSANATNVYATVAINGIDIGRRGGGTVGGAQGITNANWKLKVRAFA